MDESAIFSQAIAIFDNVAGITTTYDYDVAPWCLDDSALPAVVGNFGPMIDRDRPPGGRASDGIRETQDFTFRIYVAPAVQSATMGTLIATVEPIMGAVLDAFDARPKLTNASGTAAADFDRSTVLLDEAFITDHSGIVTRQYGRQNYFALEYTLRVSGQRVTAKVEGN
jgi:hypothetical protein